MGRKVSTEPSKKQLEILEFIYKFTKTKGFPPSMRDVGEAVNLSSSSTVFNHLQALERKGCIIRETGTTRSIRLNEENLPEKLKESLGYYEDSFETDNTKSISSSNSQGIAATGSDSDFNSVPNDEIVYVPVIGKVAAGQPLLAVENLERTFPVPLDFTRGNDVFMLRVKGESMIEVGILDGDYVLVQKQQTANNGDTVVALIEDGATVKTFYKEKDYFRLQPENRTMTAICVKELSILGKVIGVFRMM